MDWSEEEVEKAWVEWRAKPRDFVPLDALNEAMRRVMSKAVELVAARGGTMTAAEIADYNSLTALPGQWMPGPVRRILANISAQGARVAVLEAQNAEARERLEKRTAELKAERDQALSDWREYKAMKDADMAAMEARVMHVDAEAARVAEERDAAVALAAHRLSGRMEAASEVERLRERLTAAEDGNREFVRRAQQAETERDQWKTEHGSAMRRWKAEKERAEAAEARESRLLGAAEKMSAVADRTGEPEENAPMDLAETVTVTGGMVGIAPTLISKTTRYPCSPTCTHDDAATPGHAERVKERSEAVKSVAAPDPVGEAALKAGAKPGREIASYRAGYEQACDDMRAACLGAVQEWLRSEGYSPETTPVFWNGFKFAIEGAAP